MPRVEQTTDQNGVISTKELRSKNTRVNMPMTRFREKKGTIADGDRQGSDVLRESLLNFYLSHGYDPVARGSTKGFGRDLEPWEVKEVRLGNAGKFGKRAGKRAVDEWERKEKYRKTVDSITKAKKRQAEKGDGDADNFPLADQDDVVEDSNLGQHNAIYQEPTFVPSNIRVGKTSVKGKSGGSSRQGRGDKASSSKTQRYGTYGAAGTPYQSANTSNPGGHPYSGGYNAARSQYQYTNTLSNGGHSSHGGYESPYQNMNAFVGNQEAPSMGSSQPMSRQFVQSYPGIRLENDERLDFLQQESGEQTWQAQEPVDHIYHPAAQYQPQLDSSPAYTSRNWYGPPTQHQGALENANASLEHQANTLGSGGYGMYPTPPQVLGRRGREYISEVEDDRSLDSRKRQRNSGNPGTDIRPQRRVQTGRNTRPQYYGAGGAPMPLPLPLPASVNTGNAYNPSLSPEELFGTTQPINSFSRDAEGPLVPTEEFSGSMPYSFGLDRDAAGQFNGTGSNYTGSNYTGNNYTGNNYIATNYTDTNYANNGGNYTDTNYTNNGGNVTVMTNHLNDEARGPYRHNFVHNGPTYIAEPHMFPPYQRENLVGGPTYIENHQANYNGHAPYTNAGNTPYSNRHEGLGLDHAAASNLNIGQGMSDTRARHEPQQVLGKRGPATLSREVEQDTVAPQEYGQKQRREGLGGGRQESTREPRLKRRRMHTAGGHGSLKTSAPMVQREHEARDEVHLPSPQMQPDEPVSHPFQDAQVEASHVTPPQQIYINGAMINIGNGPQVVDTQVTQQAPNDFRDTLPLNSSQSQSLDDALKYTRQAYLEWTGEQPPVTNPEDSYNVQYRELRAAFKAWWKSERNAQRSNPLPELWRMKAWSGALENWRVPKNKEHLQRR